jgi:hypothetical protein
MANPVSLHQGDAAELERLGLIRFVGSDGEAFGFELTDAGHRYAPILAAIAGVKESSNG